MAVDGPTDDSWVASIHVSRSDLSPIAAGAAIDPFRILTCAHAVRDIPADQDLWVSFPKADPSTLERRRVGRRVVADPATHLDFAVLHLAQPLPAGVRPVRLRCPRPEALRNVAWWAFGFANDDPIGNSAHGSVGEKLGWGWVRLDSKSRYMVEPGFSGSGLWCPAYDAVVALVGQANNRGDGRALTLYQIDALQPEERIGRLAEWSPEDAGPDALAAWGWRLGDDPEAWRHWNPRARGVAVDSERGYRFRGRKRALEEIVAWLDHSTSDRRVLVVTGSPGVGKSAVLGRVVTTADPTFRRLLPPDDASIKATELSVACAVHARDKTALEVATEIARAASVAIPSGLDDLAPLLRARLEEREARGFNVVIDALDEAKSPTDARLVAAGVALPLTETCADLGVRVVVGMRRGDEAGNLLEVFRGAARTIDLDDREYFELEDLIAYALASLQLAGHERTENPYQEPKVAVPLARRIAKLAGRNFLVAGLVARGHGLYDTEPVRPEHIDFTPSVRSAMRRYLSHRPPAGPVPGELALTALAFAEAPGVSSRLWTLLIAALSGPRVDEREVRTFAASSAANFLVQETSTVEGKIYRLFHQALNDALLAERAVMHEVEDDERAIARALIDHGRSLGWQAAPGYLLRSLPAHAARAGFVDKLLVDDDYLLRADLHRLLSAAGAANTERGRRRARLLRLTPDAARVGAGARGALLSVTNALEGLAVGLEPTPGQPYQARWAATKPRSELAKLEGHTGQVYSVCPVAIEGRSFLASAGDDGTVRLWDPRSGEPVAALEGHAGRVNWVCPVAVEGRSLLASASEDRTVRLWDPATRKAVATLEGHTGQVYSVCAVAVEGRSLLASASEDRTVRLWDAVSGEAVARLEGHTGWVNSICPVAVEGRSLLASAGDDRAVRLWDAVSGEPVGMIEGHTGQVYSVCAMGVEGPGLLASAGDAVRLWDATSGEPVGMIEGHTGQVNSVCPVAVEGRNLLASAGDDRSVRLWDAVSGQPVGTLEGHTGPVYSVCPVVVEGRNLLASAGRDGAVRLWDAVSGEPVAALEGHTGWVRAVCPVAAAGIPALLASAGRDGSVRLWDAGSGEPVGTLEGHTGQVYSVCGVAAEDRNLLASAGDDGAVRLWDATSGELVRTLEGHTGRVYSVCPVVAEDRSFLASAGGDGSVRLWDATSGELVRTLEGHTGQVHSVCPVVVEGWSLLASAGDDRAVRLWDAGSGEPVARLEGHTDWVNSVCSVAVEDRILLASAGRDRAVRLWDAMSGELIASLEGHTGSVYSVCPVVVEGRSLLASASRDGAVRLWDAMSGRLEVIARVDHAALAVAPLGDALAVGLTVGLLVLDLSLDARS